MSGRSIFVLRDRVAMLRAEFQHGGSVGKVADGLAEVRASIREVQEEVADLEGDVRALMAEVERAQGGPA